MKKFLCSAIVVFLMMYTLSGCVPAVEDITTEPSPELSSKPIVEPSLALPPQSTAEPSITPSMAPVEKSSSAPTVTETVEPSSGITLNIANEPPLDEQSLSIAVPDFLDSEQQLLYRRAYCVYSHLFGGDTGEVNVWQTGDKYPDGMNDVEHNGMFYTKACGRYATWANFDALVHSVFTDEFWTQLNGDADSGVFININNTLHFIWASRGMYYYNDDIPDKFELISKNEDEIIFTLIGHFSAPWDEVGKTEEGLQLGSEYEYTIEFPMKLVRTQNSWRFAEFHSALADQKGPEA